MTYKVAEVVFAEVSRRLVLVDDLLHRFVLLNVAFKEVQGRVVPVEKGVLHILLQGDLQLSA